MIVLENTEISGFEAAIRGMRNPMNSWNRSDSFFSEDCPDCPKQDSCYYGAFRCDNGICYEVGNNDIELMQNLFNSGSDHRKFMRFVTVTVDCTAPLYWWKEYDTYKVGTVANSCSTMHKIHSKPFELNDFSHEHLYNIALDNLNGTIELLNRCRESYNQTKNKDDWWQMIQLLPSSYNQRRTLLLNYEVLANIRKSREGHKLDEWKTFCAWIYGLPYFTKITQEE